MRSRRTHLLAIMFNRLLVIERDPLALCSLLERLPDRYTVMGLRSPEAALSASPELYDAILVAVDGHHFRQAVRLARTLRSRLITTPVIFSSGDPAVAHLADKAAAFAFVEKPYRRPQLETVIGRAMGALGSA
jgi:FixJ family two-component response regulator